MPPAPNFHQVPKNVVIDFLRETLPFSELGEADLDELAASSLIGFFPRGTIVFEQDITEVKDLYVVQKGAVKVSFRSEDNVESLMDFRGEGSYFWAVDIISGAKAQVNVETLEDTFCFVIAKEAFLEVIGRNPSFALTMCSDSLRTSFGLPIRICGLVSWNPERTNPSFCSAREWVM